MGKIKIDLKKNNAFGPMLMELLIYFLHFFTFCRIKNKKQNKKYLSSGFFFMNFSPQYMI